MTNRRRLVWLAALVIALLVVPDGVTGAFQGGAGPAVPADLKPLLAARVSEMRLVVTRYNADRNTLNANYAGPDGFHVAGGGGRRGGGAAPAAPAVPVPVSPARLARLKRFDLDWQAALGKLDRRQAVRRGRRGSDDAAEAPSTPTSKQIEADGLDARADLARAAVRAQARPARRGRAFAWTTSIRSRRRAR